MATDPFMGKVGKNVVGNGYTFLGANLTPAMAADIATNGVQLRASTVEVQNVINGFIAHLRNGGIDASELKEPVQRLIEQQQTADGNLISRMGPPLCPARGLYGLMDSMPISCSQYLASAKGVALGALVQTGANVIAKAVGNNFISTNPVLANVTMELGQLGQVASQATTAQYLQATAAIGGNTNRIQMLGAAGTCCQAATALATGLLTILALKNSKPNGNATLNQGAYERTANVINTLAPIATGVISVLQTKEALGTATQICSEGLGTYLKQVEPLITRYGHASLLAQGFVQVMNRQAPGLQLDVRFLDYLEQQHIPVVPIARRMEDAVKPTGQSYRTTDGGVYIPG